MIFATGVVAASPVSADTGVGAGVYAAVGGHELDAGLEQLLQSALDSQFVGVEVAVVRGHLVISGYATPGVHTAVLAIIANLLQNPVPVPVALAISTPNLGLNLPFLDLGTDIELPDLSGLLHVLNIVDQVRIVR